MCSRLLLLCLFFLQLFSAHSQTGTIKGYIKDAKTGVELEGVRVQIVGTTLSANSNGEGYYVIQGIEPGTYKIISSLQGYADDTVRLEITAKVLVQAIYLEPTIYDIGPIEATDTRKKRKKEDVEVGTTHIPARLLHKIPTVGGTPDLAQYLQILPGVVFSGDQGGQLYIRGGSPVMNKIILDGMTIYNPFHSIGLFSVFDVDLMKSADVYSAGFGVQYGGRISAIVDVKTRDGNRNKLAGNFTVSPFLGKLSLEGPLKKFRPGRGSTSFILSVKNSYLDRSSQIFYTYANRLPYKFNDIYGKISFNAANGSNAKVFGFNFSDDVNFPGSTHYHWNQTGFGTRFTLIPEGKQSKVDGFITYSDYFISQNEVDNKPRGSGISGLNFGVTALAYNYKDEIRYGMEINAFTTDFNIFNANNRQIGQNENTTELCGFALYKFVRNKFTLETGLRLQYYASLGNTSIEPRINGKYALSNKLTFKAAAGKYSQNLLSAFSDRDVVNLFYGFLSGPDNLQKDFDGKPVTSRLQLAWHAVAGFDYDIDKYSELGIESFYKGFTQLTNINRDKLFDDDGSFPEQPEYLKKDFVVEKGNAYGGDIHYKYDNKRLFIWAVYSLTYVNRYDGIINYHPHWDRRHNANIVVDYALDKKGKMSANVRWNFGTGFPFTQTQGFYEQFNFQNGPSSNYTTGAGTLGIDYGPFNQGRLPTYHRLDASVKYNMKHTKSFKSWLIFSVTNVYNRQNIFYFDRVNYVRVNQLPILPSISYNASF